MDCIYVVHGHGGLIKVGRSTNFKRRLPALRQEFKRYGDEVVGFTSFNLFDDHQAFCAERDLLDKLNGHLEPYAGREWFQGDAHIAIEAAAITAQEELFRKPRYRRPRMSSEEMERLTLKRARERAELAIRQAAHTASYQAEKEARRERRELRRAEIAQRLGKQVSQPTKGGGVSGFHPATVLFFPCFDET